MSAIEAINGWSLFWAELMGWRVIDSTIVFGIVACLWLFLRKRVPAQVGYLLFLLVLVKVMIPGSYSISMQSIFPHSERSTSRLIHINNPAGGEFMASSVISPQVNPGGYPANSSPREAHQKIIEAASIAKIDPIETRPHLSFWSILMMSWGSIVLLLLTRFGGYQWIILRKVQCSKALNIDDLPVDASALKERARVKCSIRWLECSWSHSPIVWGVFRPAILLPSGLCADYSPKQVEWILLHELIHIRRRDNIVSVFQGIMQISFFFHPVVWVTNRLIDQQREYVCDDEALNGSSITGVECGEGLLSIAQKSNNLPPYVMASMGLMKTNQLIRRRIMRISDAKRHFHTRLSIPMIVLLFIVSVVLLSLTGEGDANSNNLTQLVDSANENISSHESRNEPEMVLRRIKSGRGSDDTSLPSKDGKFIVEVDDDAGSIIIRSLQTGEINHITEKTNENGSRDWPGNPIISPNNQQVCFGWFNSQNEYWWELRLVGLGKPGHQVLFRDHKQTYLQAYQFSSDGKHVLFVYSKKDSSNKERYSIAMASIENKSVEVLKILTKWPKFVCFSPDNRYIVFDYPEQNNESNSDIAILEINTKREIPLIVHPANDKVLGWSPDGEWILFTSDRISKGDVWIVRVGNGALQGPAMRIMETISASIIPKGFTPDGTFYYSINHNNLNDIYIGDFDHFMKIYSPIPCKGSKTGGVWSNDGTLLAFNVWPTRNSNILNILNRESGEVREIATPNLGLFHHLCWSPDDNYIYTITNGDNEIHRIEIQTGASTLVLKQEEQVQIMDVDCAKDGTLFLENHKRMRDSEGNVETFEWIEKCNLKSGEKVQLASDQNLHFNIDLSPNDKWLAYNTYDWDDESAALRIIPTAGGESLELAKWEKQGGIGSIEWLSDDRILILKRGGGDQSEQMFLWSVSTKDHSRQLLWEPNEYIRSFDVSPDNKFVAFGKGRWMHEVWAMENFLPSE